MFGSEVPFPASVAGLGISAGVPISLSLELDDSVPDSAARSDTGLYSGAIVGGELVAGNLTMTIWSGTVAAALDRVGDKSLYRLSTDLGGVTSSVRGVLGFPFLSVDLVDSGQDVIDTTAFPAPPPDLADLDSYLPGIFPQSPFVTSVQFGLFAEDSGFAVAEISSVTT